MSAELSEIDMAANIDWEPASHAATMAEDVAENKEIQAEILEDAVGSDEEVGKTICGTTADTKEPIESGFDSITLPGCRVGHRGMLHAGGGHDLHAPMNSLLDMANVLFGRASVVAVLGTRRSDLFLQPTEDQLAQAQLAFQDAIGIEVETLEDYVQARQDRRVRNPIQAAQRLREELDLLFITVKTPHPEIEAQIGTSLAAPLGVDVSQALHQTSERFGNILSSFLTIANAFFDFELEEVSINIPSLFVSEIASAIVLLVFLAAFGATPSRLVRANSA